MGKYEEQFKILNRKDLREEYDHYFPDWWEATYWGPKFDPEGYRSWERGEPFVTELNTSEGLITVTYEDFFGLEFRK